MGADTVLRGGPTVEPSGPTRARWLPWLLGLAMVGAVVLGALHISEQRHFLHLVRRARPGWLLAAALLQAFTYVAQGEIWRLVTRAGRVALDVVTAYRLSVARLFIDQALPSAGLSGTVVMVKALEEHGIPRRVVMAGVVVDTASCYATYVAGIAAALAIMLLERLPTGTVMLAAAPIVPFALAIAVGFISLSGRPAGRFARRLARFRFLRKGLGLLEQAEPRLARSPRLLLGASACQLTVILLDAATIWLLIGALGTTASPGGVFVSFMLSTLFRIVGVAPGGLGSFEAASVLTLTLVGVKVPVALSATLLFRGMSFWLPLLPGLWFSRRYMGRAPRRRA
jgi:uncharacterized protein (TIRG00374 family)